LLEGKVSSLENPFGTEKLSQDGKPTIPVLIFPYDNFIFKHQPRLVDFRWYPSSGKYPMRYTIEIDERLPGRWQSYEKKANIPYYSYTFRSSIFRWRVKAINSLGESAWSEYRYLIFISPKDKNESEDKDNNLGKAKLLEYIKECKDDKAVPLEEPK